jgi:hypothetical protein
MLFPLARRLPESAGSSRALVACAVTLFCARLSPVPTATGHLTLAIVRDVTQARQRDDLVELAWAAVAADQAHRSQGLLDRVVSSLFHVGVSLQAAIGLPHHTARQRITEALQHLDDTIHDIRDHMFTTSSRLARPGPVPPRSAAP